MAVPGIRLNPAEATQAEYIQQQVLANPGLAEQVGPMFFGLLDQAANRRTTNQQTRRAGVASLQEMAMQLAAGGADPTAVENAITGQAQGLPGIGTRQGQEQLGGLSDYVGGLYNGAPISGLASPDVRAAFGTSLGLLDEEDQMAVGGLVDTAMQSGATPEDIEAQVRRTAVAAGYSPEEESAALEYAQSIYERLAGLSSGEMAQTASSLAGRGGDLDFLVERLNSAGNPALAQAVSDYMENMGAEGFNPDMEAQRLVSSAAADPSRLGNLYEILKDTPIGSTGPGSSPSPSTGWLNPIRY